MSDDYAGVHTCHANCTKWYCLLRKENEHLKKRIEFDNQTLEATCKRLEKTHASWMIVKADNAKLQESVLAEHQAAVDMFSKYDALRDENTQLKDEVGQLRQQIGEHTCDPNVFERLACIRMQAVVDAARACNEEVLFTQSNRISMVLAEKLFDALKALDDGSAG